jgi:hypothetical protein
MYTGNCLEGEWKGRGEKERILRGEEDGSMLCISI